jgi:hypothetical protein
LEINNWTLEWPTEEGFYFSYEIVNFLGKINCYLRTTEVRFVGSPEFKVWIRGGEMISPDSFSKTTVYFKKIEDPGPFPQISENDKW